MTDGFINVIKEEEDLGTPMMTVISEILEVIEEIIDETKGHE